MGTVAQRRTLGLFALTEEQWPVFVGCIFHGFKRSAFVRAIAEWLGLRQAAATPPIGFTSFDVDLSGFFGGDSGLIHKTSPPDVFADYPDS